MRSICSRYLPWFVIGIFALGLTACQRKQEQVAKIKQSSETPVYDEQADARVDITRAIDRASMTNKRILLVFGANWCQWCRALHHLFESDAEIHQYLKRHFEVVLIDVGRRNKNMDLNEKYGNPVANGLPVIVVLDSAGHLLATQETGVLELPQVKEKEYGHDRTKVLDFLRHWGETVQTT